MLRIKDVDLINKEYFTEGNPAFWFAIGVIFCSIRTISAFQNIKGGASISVFFFFLFLFGSIWCIYGLLTVFSYKKAPMKSPARILWLKNEKRKWSYISEKYNHFLAPKITPIIQAIGDFFLIVFWLGLIIVGIIAGIYSVSQLSIHSLLILIVVLILLK